MTPLISAETGEGAAGCASGSHTCKGTSPAFAPKPTRASKKATAARCDARCAPRIAHRIERKLPTPTLHHPEAQEYRDRPEMRHQQKDKAGTADLRDCVLCGDEKVRRQGHGLPSHHERVGIIRQQYETHAGEEQVVLQAHEPR